VDLSKLKERKSETIEVNGERIVCRELTAEDVEALQQLQGTASTKHAIVLACTDEQGQPIATDAQDLDGVPLRVLEQLAEPILRLSGMTDDALEGEVKN
jgi:hypothetical protein